MSQLCVHRDMKHLGSLESTQEARVALGYASSNSYASSYLDERTLTMARNRGQSAVLTAGACLLLFAFLCRRSAVCYLSRYDCYCYYMSLLTHSKLSVKDRAHPQQIWYSLSLSWQHVPKRDFQSPISILKMNRMEVYLTFCSADNFFFV